MRGQSENSRSYQTEISVAVNGLLEHYGINILAFTILFYLVYQSFIYEGISTPFNQMLIDMLFPCYSRQHTNGKHAISLCNMLMPSPVPIEAAKQPIEMCSCCCVSPPSKSVYLEELIVRQRVQFLRNWSAIIRESIL